MCSEGCWSPPGSSGWSRAKDEQFAKREIQQRCYSNADRVRRQIVHPNRAREETHPQQVRAKRNKAIRQMKSQQPLAKARRPARPPRPPLMPVEVVENGQFDGQSRRRQRRQFGELFQRRQCAQLHQNTGQADRIEAQPSLDQSRRSSLYNWTVCRMAVIAKMANTPIAPIANPTSKSRQVSPNQAICGFM